MWNDQREIRRYHNFSPLLDVGVPSMHVSARDLDALGESYKRHMVTRCIINALVIVNDIAYVSNKNPKFISTEIIIDGSYGEIQGLDAYEVNNYVKGSFTRPEVRKIYDKLARFEFWLAKNNTVDGPKRIRA